MSQPDKHIYEFERYQLNVGQRQLLRNNRHVRLNPKAFDLLVFLIQNHGRLVTKEEIWETVWQEKVWTNTADHRIFAQIRKIRKVLGKWGRRKTEDYIVNIPGKGYQFIASVQIAPIQAESIEGSAEANTLSVGPILMTSEEEQDMDTGGTYPDPAPIPPVKDYQREIETPVPSQQPAPKRGGRQRVLLVLLLVGLLVAAVFWYRNREIATIKHVVRESQMYEALVAYTNPDVFDEKTLNKYWLDESQEGRDIKRVKNSLATLRKERRRYGKESRLVSFDFLSVDWLPFNNTAQVKTQESWFLPMYYLDGRPYPRKPEQSWEGLYILRKVAGVWLIQGATLPPPKPIPTPSLAGANPSVAPTQ